MMNRDMPGGNSARARYDPREEERTWWDSEKAFPPGHHFAHDSVRSRIYSTLLSLGCHGDSSILDLGCGAGEDAVYVSRISRRITGVDLSYRALGQFNAKGFGGLIADVQLLPFRGNSFDFTVCSGLLHHLVGQGSLTDYLREFTRVTRPGGYVLAMEPNVFNHSGLLMNIFNTLKPGITGLVPHERALSPLKLRSVFTGAGLSGVKVEAASFVWNRFPLAVSQFIYRHENGIRTRMPFSLFGWFEIVYGCKL